MNEDFNYDRFEPFFAKGKVLRETSLNRLNYHTKYGFIIVSANKSSVDSSLEEDFLQWCKEHNFDSEEPFTETTYLKYRNLTADKELMSYLRSSDNKFSFTPINGGYRDKKGNTDSFEPSFIIYNRYKKDTKNQDYERTWEDLYDLALQICEAYEQDSVYIQAPNEAPKYVNSKGETVSSRSSKKMKYNDTNQEYFSTITRYGASRGKRSPVRRFTSDISFDESVPTLRNLIESKSLYTRSTPSTYNAKLRRSSFGEVWDILE